MFKSKTVFVIGAGASCEAGLPSGEKLKARISDLLNIRFDDGFTQSHGDHQIVHSLREAAQASGHRDINPYLEKAWRIRDVVPAAAISIDNFLDAHRGDEVMELCGKLGIVKSILDAEGESLLRDLDHGERRFSLRALADTWYVSFFQMLTENVPKAEASTVFENVSIITFNYDRCIERFLVQTLGDYYDLPDAECEKIVGTLEMYHPYGTVGPLPWQDRGLGISFGSSRADLLSAAKRIKTFTEGLDDDDLLLKMREQIYAAETVVFLGFAFHPMNMDILAPGHETDTKRIFATTLGMSDADEGVIEDDIWRMLGMTDLDWQDKQLRKPEMANTTCRIFFQQYFRSLSSVAE